MRLWADGCDAATSGALLERLRDKARQVRADTLRASLGTPHHLGGALSCVEILVVLHHHLLAIAEEAGVDQRLVFSKGHACTSLYATLVDLGIVTDLDLRQTMRLGGRLLGHPCRTTTPGIDASTGSLGQGLSMAVGMGLACRRTGRPAAIFALLGDSELQSGQTWEALLLLAQLRLTAVRPIIDCNGLQADGRLSEIVGLDPLSTKLSALGLDAVDCDGHDLGCLIDALGRPAGDRPIVVIAHTVKGAGVPFMEGEAGWHSGMLSERQLADALACVVDDAPIGQPS